MNFTDIFIKRPVLAVVVSLLIFIFGLRAMSDLPLRQYPDVKNTIVSVTTVYPGANANLIQGFITTPLQKSIASAEGIAYIEATSQNNTSIIRAHIAVNFDPQDAFTNVMGKISEASGELPQEAEKPIASLADNMGSALMYINFNSETMTPEQMTDYVARAVNPKLETVEGVAASSIFGGKTFSMRIWLDPSRMAAYNLTPPEVVAALQRSNVQTAAGHTKGAYYSTSILAKTDISDADHFAAIVLKNDAGSLVRLKDVADVELGSEGYSSFASFNAKPGVFIGISATPSANPLTVIENVQKAFSELQRDMPAALNSLIVYDATQYIRYSIYEVVRTIIEATLIVVVVIFLFLGNLRSVVIPIIAIPLSLVGVGTVMLMLGYSINLLTLLAMVLAIGMVVDDAIVVVENIHRHIEQGKKPLNAALDGAREIALPVVAMTLTLAAVYTPIGFLTGITGALFSEFAFTLAASVVLSGIIALTLSPMLSAKLLRKNQADGRLTAFLDRQFMRLQMTYQASLQRVLNARWVVVTFTVILSASIFMMYTMTNKELAPEEDVGFFFVVSKGPEYANVDYIRAYTNPLNQIYADIEEQENYFTFSGFMGENSAASGIVLKPWGEREKSQKQLQGPLQQNLDKNPGLRNFAIVPNLLPGASSGRPFHMVITSLTDHKDLVEVAEKLVEFAESSGQFVGVSSSLQYSKPEAVLNVDREKAADLGIDMQAISQALGATLSGAQINRFNLEGRSYKVIPQLGRIHRLDPQQLTAIHVRAGNGELIPLSTIATVEKVTAPNALTQFQQLNSTSIEAIPMIPMGQAIEVLEAEARKLLKPGMSIDYAGDTRQFKKESNALLYAFFFSLIVIYLVLSAQYESFRDPLIILISVPLCMFGALLPLFLGFAGASLNIYTQVGLITLIGLITKHGILMVDFAKNLQLSQGYSRHQAISEAAAIRLRPILMTTAAMIFAVIPLIIPHLLGPAPGGASRFNMGIVIAVGMFIGTLFTIYVLPTFYTMIARERSRAA